MSLSQGVFRTCALVTVIVVLAAACFAGAGNGTGSFADRLALVPASVTASLDGRPIQVAMADLDLAAELAGVERPTDATAVDGVHEYAIRVSGTVGPSRDEPPVVAALFPDVTATDRLAQVEEFDQELGWSVANVSWFVEYQVPPETFAVLGGDFDEERLTTAMGDREDNIWRLGGEDGAPPDPSNTTAARPLGLPLRLALDGERLVVGQTTPPVEDALEGAGDTLADDEVLRDLAQAMDGQDVYAALFLAGGDHGLGGANLTPEQVAALESELLPEAFRGIAGGVTSREGEAFVVFAYAHDDDNAAEANAEALRALLEQGRSLRNDAPWTEAFTVDDIQTDGSTLVARLGLGERSHPRLAYDVLFSRDSLAIHR